jgi:hypothetical protein
MPGTTLMVLRRCFARKRLPAVADLVGGRIHCQNCILVYIKEMLPNSDELRILSLYRVLVLSLNQR